MRRSMVGNTFSSASPKGERVKKTIRLLMLLLAGLAIALSASALPAAAAPGNTFPGGSAYVDNQSHSISPDASLWYRFDYAGDRSAITLTLVNGTNSGVGFNVFTPAQIGDWWDEPPVGRGTAQALSCNTGMPENGGACADTSLTWVGNFPENGTYYVKVVNNNSGALTFQLTIAGSGVNVAPQMSAPSTSAAQPIGTGTAAPNGTAVMTLPAGSNIDPGHAAVMDNNSHSIPGSTAMWYRFDYVVNHSDVTITMPNGKNSGLGFNVFTSSQTGDWWDEQPVGRGTAQAVNCSSMLPDTSGNCQANDLTWTGSFNTNGTVYVQVVNNNDSPSTWQLMIEGEGVALGQ
jgi:hypothetical protein